MKALYMHRLLERLKPLIINLLYLEKIVDKVDVDDDRGKNSKEWCNKVLNEEKSIFWYTILVSLVLLGLAPSCYG